jgi:hypothetical protein
MRVGREAAAGFQLAAEVPELFLVDPPFEIRSRVHPRSGMPLEEDHVAVLVGILPPEEVIEGHLVKSRRRGVSRDVAADAFLGLVRPDHHCERVPADQALDPALDVRLARHRHLLVGRNGVDVGGVGRERQFHAVLARVNRQLAQQPRHFDRTTALEHII